MASDHFHPWVPSQGHSAFVWSWMGALGVRDQPALRHRRDAAGLPLPPGDHRPGGGDAGGDVPGRFYLGLGAGEALNEHIVGEYWPEAPIRLERLMESIEIINKLFTGKVVKHRAQHFNVESAKLYTLPDDAAADLRRHLRADQGLAHRQDAPTA